MTAASAGDTRAFAGVRVLDFTHYLAGPVGTAQLAMQGADVIKIESFDGDAMRTIGAGRAGIERKLGSAWMSANVNKRCLALDLNKPRAIEIVRRLARDADVLCENFRPGVLERRGIGWSQLSAINPRLIYCAVSGFGASGPDAGTAAFDGKIQAISGIMSLTGEPASGPTRAGFAMVDMATGLMAAFAMATAIHQRSRTGRGQFIDLAMLDTALNMLASQVAEHLNDGTVHPQTGNASISGLPTADRFRCADGYLVLAVLTEKQYRNLLSAIGRTDLLDDPRFTDWTTRKAHAAELRAIIEEQLARAGGAEWEQRFTAADVPCGAVLPISEIVKHPALAHRGLLQRVDSPFGPVTLPGPAFRLAHGNGGIHSPGNVIGGDSVAILREAGYGEAEIETLRAERVFIG